MLREWTAEGANTDGKAREGAVSRRSSSRREFDMANKIPPCWSGAGGA